MQTIGRYPGLTNQVTPMGAPICGRPEDVIQTLSVPSKSPDTRFPQKPVISKAAVPLQIFPAAQAFLLTAISTAARPQSSP